MQIPDCFVFEVGGAIKVYKMILDKKEIYKRDLV